MTEKKAILKVEGREDLELPIHTPTLGQDVIDVSSLTANGIFTFDPGFTSTASCESKITYIDGEKGQLLHRGYSIEELASKSDYLEVCYLLLNGELPSAEQKAEFVSTVKNHTMVHEQIRNFFNGFRRDAHPMAIMCGVVGALSAFYHDSLDINNPTHRDVTAFRLIAKMPTIAAMCYKYGLGQPLMYPRNDLGYAENFLHMMFGNPPPPGAAPDRHRRGCASARRRGGSRASSRRSTTRPHPAQPERGATPRTRAACITGPALVIRVAFEPRRGIISDPRWRKVQRRQRLLRVTASSRSTVARASITTSGIATRPGWSSSAARHVPCETTRRI